MTEVAAQRPGGVVPPVALMGVPFDNLTMSQAVRAIEAMILSGRPHWVATANLDFLAQAARDAALHRVLLQADRVLCDGMPLVWLSKLVGNPLPERVAGSDLTPLLLDLAARRGYRVFLLGGEPESSALAEKNIMRRHPGTTICGRLSPPCAPLSEMNHDRIIDTIRESRPDLLLVSFGCPKQEKWMAQYCQRLGVPVVIGVGGTIDFLSGRVRRAPVWMRRSGAEWVFRLIGDPRRLLGRYSRDLKFLMKFAFGQLWRTRLCAVFVAAPAEAPVVHSCGKTARIALLGRLDGRAARRHAAALEQSIAIGGVNRLDLSGVRAIDSAGIGLLLRLRKRGGENSMVLVKPSKPVRAALRQMRLEAFFKTAAA